MRKIAILVFTAAFLLFLSACSHKPMSEKVEQEAIYNSLKNMSNMSKWKADNLLKETETNLGINEFRKITSITNVLQNVDAIVCFTAIDGTDYYALYTYINSMCELVRIRKDNLKDGDLVYTRGIHDCRFYIKSVNEKECCLVLENWNGVLIYEMAFILETQTGNGEWETVAEFSGSYRSKIGQVSKEYDLLWVNGGISLPTGHYRLTLPVFCARTKWEFNQSSINDFESYSENVDLSCEFDIEVQ